jgi:hypothetical protein
MDMRDFSAASHSFQGLAVYDQSAERQRQGNASRDSRPDQHQHFAHHHRDDVAG